MVGINYDPELLMKTLEEKMDENGYVMSKDLKPVFFKTKSPSSTAGIFLKIFHEALGLQQFFSTYHGYFIYAVSKEDIPKEFLEVKVKKLL
jgi:hypothetical protein